MYTRSARIDWFQGCHYREHIPTLEHAAEIETYRVMQTFTSLITVDPPTLFVNEFSKILNSQGKQRNNRKMSLGAAFQLGLQWVGQGPGASRFRGPYDTVCRSWELFSVKWKLNILPRKMHFILFFFIFFFILHEIVINHPYLYFRHTSFLIISIHFFFVLILSRFLSTLISFIFSRPLSCTTHFFII